MFNVRNARQGGMMDSFTRQMLLGVACSRLLRLASCDDDETLGGFMSLVHVLLKH